MNSRSGAGSFGSGNQFGQGMASILGGLFTDPSKPFKEAERAYGPRMDQASGYFNPFYQAGTGAIGDYQNWLGGMKDPSGFINNMMGQYQESPWAKYQQEQARQGGINAASASGLMGSTPYLQAAEEMSGNIASQDMQNWLQNVLGINTQYGQGVGNLMGQGFNAATGLGNLTARRAEDEAGFKYGREAGNQQRYADIFGGIGSMMGFPPGAENFMGRFL